MALGAVACASSSPNQPTGFGTVGTSGANTNGASGGAGSGGGLGESGNNLLGQVVGGSSGSSSDSGARPQRCDAQGMNCTCFNIASIGIGGQTGAQAGTTSAKDNVQAFLSYLNSASSIGIAQLGCSTDAGCMSPTKPTLTAAFLGQYDVIIFQWMANSIVVNPKGGYDGVGYWTWGADELAALKTWVNGGGGMIVLSGYANDNMMNLEINPANQLLGAVSGIQFAPSDTFGAVETGNASYCLGDSDPATGWSATTPLGENITEVGAFHGKTVVPGPMSIVDCKDPVNGVLAAHEDLGKGHVYAYGDEWVTYTSQWDPPPGQPAGYCSLDGSTANGDVPAVQVAYQVPQFWENAISYASQATMCPFHIPNTIPR